MSIIGSFDRTLHFSELNEPLLDSPQGAMTPEERKAAARTNLGATSAAALTTGAGVGITGGTGTVYQSSVQKAGGIYYTTILVDVTGLNSSATNNDIIGTDGVGVAHLGQITAAQNGTILTLKMTCLEAPLTGDPDIDLYSAAEATGVEDTLITALTETVLVNSNASWTNGRVLSGSAVPAANEYLYLTVGNTGVAGTYTAGKFMIELTGYDA